MSKYEIAVEELAGLIRTAIRHGAHNTLPSKEYIHDESARVLDAILAAAAP